MSLSDPASKRRDLLREFEQSIAPQKLQIAQSLPHLWKRCYEPPPVAPVPVTIPQPMAKAVGTGGALGLSPAKKVKVQGRPEVASKKLEEMWKQCDNIIRRLMKRKEAEHFNQPVTAGIAGDAYFTIIDQPMDLGTIKTKLQKREYNTPDEVATDIRLVWSNCRTFTPDAKHWIRKLEKAMSDAFEKMWEESPVRMMWRDAQNDSDPGYKAAVELESEITVLSSQLNSFVRALPAARSQPGEEMSFIQKRALSIALSTLPSSKMQAVLDIVADGCTAMHPHDEEEFDLDSLNTATLWKLHFLAFGQEGPKNGGKAGKQAAFDVARSHAAPLPAAYYGNAPADSTGQQTETDSEHGSPRDVKGSTMDEPHGQSVFVKDRQVVDESATNPREQPAFVKDKAERKTDVSINTANWSTLAVQGVAEAGAGTQADGQEGGGAVEVEGDEMWKSFQSIAEQKAQREEEHRRREEEQRAQQEKIDRERKEAAERLRREEEERQQKLREEEERELQEQERARKEQLEKELAEMQAKENTANLIQERDMSGMLSQFAGTSTNNELEAHGLQYKNDDEEGFDFDDV